MARRRKPDAAFELSVNGHTFRGEQRGGRWSFACESWPEVAEKWDGDGNARGALDDFLGRALAGAARVRLVSSGHLPGGG